MNIGKQDVTQKRQLVVVKWYVRRKCQRLAQISSRISLHIGLRYRIDNGKFLLPYLSLEKEEILTYPAGNSSETYFLFLIPIQHVQNDTIKMRRAILTNQNRRHYGYGTSIF